MKIRKSEQEEIPVPVPEPPRTLEEKLDVALEGFATLAPKLDKEQQSRHNVIVAFVVTALFLSVLVVGLFIYGQNKTSDLEDATDDLEHADAQIDAFQGQLCDLVLENRQFAIDSVVSLQESLILALTPEPGSLTPEEQDAFDKRVDAFRSDLEGRIDKLSDLDCDREAVIP